MKTDTVINIQAFIGLTEQSAKQLAEDSELGWRITNRDGKPLIITKDFYPERLNFIVSKGQIIDCRTG